MYIGIDKHQLTSSDFNETFTFFSTYFRKILKYRFSWKSVRSKPSFSMRTEGLRFWS